MKMIGAETLLSCIIYSLILIELEAAMEDRRLPHYLPGTKTGARVGNLKLDLPVDEDDYLMPSPQSTQPHHGGYMDLIGDAKLGGM